MLGAFARAWYTPRQTGSHITDNPCAQSPLSRPSLSHLHANASSTGSTFNTPTVCHPRSSGHLLSSARGGEHVLHRNQMTTLSCSSREVDHAARPCHCIQNHPQLVIALRAAQFATSRHRRWRVLKTCDMMLCAHKSANHLGWSWGAACVPPHRAASDWMKLFCSS